MPHSSDSPLLLACPRCGATQLAPRGSGLCCAACNGNYPDVGGLLCLVPDPGLWSARWRSRLDAYGAVLGERVAGWRADAARPSLLPRTRARLARVAEAMAKERERITDLALLLSGSVRSRQVPMLNPSSPSEATAAVECDEHVFRDWVWGQGEVDALRAFTESLIPEPVSNIALYGVGAARLAVDIHRSLGAQRTFALDSNPLPLLVAAKLLAGETVELHELPLWPSRDEDVVVRRTISYAEPVPPGFTLLVADALSPPFAPGSLDCVITAWFIDAVDEDLQSLAPRINRVLRPGGLWVNVGPLRWKQPLARAYSIEEVHEIVELTSFELIARQRAELPYFAGPLGGTHALETVFGFAARRTGDAPAFEPVDERPPWLVNPQLAVSATPSMVRRQHAAVLTAAILSLVDGSRSLSEMTEMAAAKWNLDPAEVEPQLRAFFDEKNES